MKKHYLAIAVLAMALGMTACSSKTSETTADTTAATTAVETTAETDASAEDEEEDYYYGFVSEVNDKVITIADDEGKEVKFDVSAAEVEGADAIGTGDEVEVVFSGQLSEDVTKANQWTSSPPLLQKQLQRLPQRLTRQSAAPLRRQTTRP